LFESVNADLVIIGNGKPENIQDIRRETHFKGKIFTDPGLASFKALGFSREITGILAPSALVGAFKAFKDGYRPSTLQGDALQLGGAVVIGPGPKLYYYFQAVKAGEHPSVQAILEGCQTDKALEAAI